MLWNYADVACSPLQKNCQFRNNSSLNNVKNALYAIAVPVRNVNKSGVRTVLATGGHVTFLPYYVQSITYYVRLSLVLWALCRQYTLKKLVPVVLYQKLARVSINLVPVFFWYHILVYRIQHIPAQKLCGTWHEPCNAIGRRAVLVQETVLYLRQIFRASFWYQFFQRASPALGSAYSDTADVNLKSSIATNWIKFCVSSSHYTAPIGVNLSKSWWGPTRVRPSPPLPLLFPPFPSFFLSLTPSLPSSTIPPSLSPSLSPLRSRTQVQLGGLRELCKLPQRDLGRTTAEIEFGAFYSYNVAFGGSDFKNFTENQLTKFT